jgi:hypothetical protein
MHPLENERIEEMKRAFLEIDEVLAVLSQNPVVLDRIQGFVCISMDFEYLVWLHNILLFTTF